MIDIECEAVFFFLLIAELELCDNAFQMATINYYQVA